MITIILLVSLFMVLATLSFFDEKKDKYVFVIYVLAAVAMFLLAGFKPIGVDRDSLLYLSYYNGLSTTDVEPSFGVIAAIARNLFGTPQFVFIIYALLSVSTRAYGITRLTDLWLISLLVWLSNLYLIQDLTQIRAAVSMGLFMCGLFYLQNSRRWVYLFFILLALIFHYSALFFFFLVFLGNKPLNRVWRTVLIVLPAIGFIMAAVKFDPIMNIPIPYIQDRIKIYVSTRDTLNAQMGEINVFNPIYLLKVVFYYLLLWKEKVISQRVTNFPLLIKIFAISIITFTLFSGIPAFAYRINELYGVVEIIVIPYLVYAIRPVVWGKIMVVGYCLVTLIFYRLIYNHLLMPI